MNKKLVLVLGFVLGFALMGAASIARADPDCPDFFSSCVFTDGFDTDADDWRNVENAQITWLSSKTFSLGLFEPHQATGLIQIDSGTANDFRIGRTTWLDAGAYRLNFRFTAEYELFTQYYVVWIYNDTTGETVQVWNSSGYDTQEFYNNFRDLTTGELVIANPGYYRIVLRVSEVTYPFYLDHAVMGRVNSNLTPGAPTYTPMPTTVPQSTPMPTPSALSCLVNDDADLVPSAQRFAYFYDAGVSPNFSPYWGRNSSAVTNGLIGFDGNEDFSSSSRSSVLLPNSTNTTTIDTRAAWILSPTWQIASTYFVFGQATAISVTTGTTQYIQVYAKDSGVWEFVGEQAVSGFYWYQFAFTDTSPSAVTQIAFVARRDDGATDGGVYADLFYVYGHEFLAPRCDGQWWNMQDGSLTLLGSVIPGSTTVMVPADRACPADINEANNFWGPIIANLTLFTDQLFALAPGHVPGNMRQIGRNLIESPVPAFFRLISVLFDLRVPMTLFGIALAMESARVLLVVFQMLKKTLPFI